MKVRKGDTVVVIAGKDKGAKGKVIQAYPDTGRILVEGVNRIKKHTKVTTTQTNFEDLSNNIVNGAFTAGVAQSNS